VNPKLRTLLVIVLFAVVVGALFQDVLFDNRVLITSNTFMWSPWRAAASRENLSEPSYRTDAARTYLESGCLLGLPLLRGPAEPGPLSGISVAGSHGPGKGYGL